MDTKTQICLYVHMRTTIVLPDDIFRRAKAEAAMEGRPLRDFILDAVVHELEQTTRGSSPPSRRVKLPLVRSKHPGAVRITGDAVSSALVAEDVHVSP
jgi:hypothetical protein